MTPHRRTIDATLRRHLSAVNRTERLSGHAGALVTAALRAAMKHLPDKPNHFNLRPALDSIREIVHRLRHVAAYMIAVRLKGMAEWGHLAMARVLTTGARRQLAKEEVYREDLWDYLRLIIRPPAAWFLKAVVGAAPDLLTRLIDPDAASDVVLQGVAAGYDRTRIAKDLTQVFGGYENAARRVARTEGLRVATQTQLSASEEIPELVIGYKVYAVPKTEYSRIDHLKRSGTSYFRNPKGDQLGFDVLPQPPFDNPGRILQNNCRCGLVPLFSIEDANSDDLRDAVNRLG